MRTQFVSILLLLPILLAAQADSNYVLIEHASECSARISWEQMKGLPTHSAKVRDHSDNENIYVGARLQDVLEQACPSIFDLDKWVRIRSAVRVTASDGYSALIALAEADTVFRDRPVLLCWQWNGQPLRERHSPFQLIVPDDDRHARDVRGVTKLQVITP